MARSSMAALGAIFGLATIPWIVSIGDSAGSFRVIMLWADFYIVPYKGYTFSILGVTSDHVLMNAGTLVGIPISLLYVSAIGCTCISIVSATSGILFGKENSSITAGLLIVSAILSIIVSIHWSAIVKDTALPLGAVAVSFVILQFYRPVIPYLDEPRPDSESSSIQSVGTNTSEGDSKTTTSDSSTNDQTTTDTTDTQVTAEEIQTDAEAARKAAKSAKANGDSKTAIEEYRGAINLYQTAREELPAVEAERRDELTEAIESTRADLETVKTQREQQNEVIEALQPAERSLQEAIVAFVENDQTVARIRFRQARDTFEDAHETIVESEEELLTEPVTVDVQPDQEPPSTTLSELSVIPEAAETELADAGIETVDDLDSNAESPWTPNVIEELVADDTIDEDIATTLTLLSWWHGDEGYTFETAKAVARRQQQADHGFNHTS